jgi:hypothetical protein
MDLSGDEDEKEYSLKREMKMKSILDDKEESDKVSCAQNLRLVDISNQYC